MKIFTKALSLVAVGVSLAAGSTFYSTSAEAACVVGVRSNDVLNIRSRPSGASRIKGVVPPGSCRMRVYQRGARWSRISYRGVFGWVSNRFVREL